MTFADKIAKIHNDYVSRRITLSEYCAALAAAQQRK
jgi:hypothetical protein